MTYTPINWQNGDTITADKMNKMDNGWSVGTTVLTSETVTTEDYEGQVSGLFAYATPITAETIIVTFDGTQYTCNAVAEEGNIRYGDYDFIATPFVIISGEEFGNALLTPNPGTYSVTVSTLSAEVSSQFAIAVNSAIPELIPTFKLVIDETTIAEYKEARDSNRFCYMYDGSVQRMVTSVGFPSSGKTPLNVLPTLGSGSYAFDSDGVLRFYS